MASETLGERPRFVGGPLDGQRIGERFPPGHMLHGTLPSGVLIPTHAPPLPPGLMHRYDYEAGDYQYRGAEPRREVPNGE